MTPPPVFSLYSSLSPRPRSIASPACLDSEQCFCSDPLSEAWPPKGRIPISQWSLLLDLQREKSVAAKEGTSLSLLSSTQGDHSVSSTGVTTKGTDAQTTLGMSTWPSG